MEIKKEEDKMLISELEEKLWALKKELASWLLDECQNEAVRWQIEVLKNTTPIFPTR